MKGSDSSRVVIDRATLFAIAGFGLNMLTAGGESPYRAYLGDIVLFVGAASSTPVAAFILAGLGAIPFALFIDSPTYGAITTLILLGIGLRPSYLSRIPPYLVATAVWTFFVAPYAMIKGPPGWPQPWAAQAFLFYGITSLLTAIVAGAALLNHSIWCRLVGRPRITTSLDLLLHVLPLCSMISVLALVALANRAGGIPSGLLAFGHPAFLIGLLCVVVALPALIACRLSALLRHVDEPVVANSGDPYSSGFSGRSSDYWKRAIANGEFWTPHPESRPEEGSLNIAYRKLPSGEVSIRIDDTNQERVLDPRIVSAQRVDTLGGLMSGAARSLSDGLTAIVARASNAKRSTTDQHMVSVLDEIEGDARRSGTVVRQLLEFADGPEDTKTITNLCDTVNEVGPLLTSLLGFPTSVSIELHSRQLFVEIDRQLFVQALSNLLLNARDAYGVTGGNILIQLDEEQIFEESSVVQPDLSPGHYARLRVQDTAAGMSSDILSRAFDPLFTTRSEAGHSGMGLATVLAIVRSHGGFLTAESRPDRGTSITLYFPLVDHTPADEANDATQVDPPSNGMRPPGQTKVLVVEQRDERRQVLSDMLCGLGYSVVDCRSPSEALELSRDNPFDLVLLDEALPGLDCDQFIDRLRDEAAGQPKALILSPITQPSAEDGCRRLVKPFGVEDLHEAINQTLH